VCCSATRSLAVAKVQMIEHRCEELQQLRAELVRWIADCDANSANVTCPVIDHLETDASTTVVIAIAGRLRTDCETRSNRG
jgi:hypothetical protein